MKNSIKILMGIIIIASILVSSYSIVYADTVPTFQDLATMFNTVQETKGSALPFTASVVDDELKITGTEGYMQGYVFSYYYEPGSSEGAGNPIMAGQYIGNDTTVLNWWKEVSKVLVDCVGRWHNYSGGELFETLDSREIESYTLQDHGVEIKKRADDFYQVRINLGAVVPIINAHNAIEPADLEDYRDQIIGNGNPLIGVGNIKFYKYTINDTDYLTIAEVDGLTYLTDNSLLSVIKVFFNGDETKIAYFTNNYSSVAEGNKEFGGIKVEVNPAKNLEEEIKLGTNTPFVRVTINRQGVQEAIYGKTESDSSTTGSSSNGGSGSLPKTGGEVNKGMVTLYVIMCAAGVGVIIMAASSRKQK